jgi:hypothetical protein
LIILYDSFLLVINYLTKSFTSFTTSREAPVLVELITCWALGLMRIAHLQSISSARTHELNRITFTYYATSIPRYDYVSCYASRVNRQHPNIALITQTSKLCLTRTLSIYNKSFLSCKSSPLYIAY